MPFWVGGTLRVRGGPLELSTRRNFLQSMGSLLVLPFLRAEEPEVILRIQQISGERLEILQGSFYTAIYRLERRGWIKGEWGESENTRRARFYSLTAAGRRQLQAETAKWTDMAAVVAGILAKKAQEI